MPHESLTAQPAARQVGRSPLVLVAITLGLLVAVLAFILVELPEQTDTDLSLEAERMNALTPAAGSPDQPPQGADSFISPDRRAPAPRLGPADSLEPLQPRFR